jgi:hypothetical protein
MVNVTVVVTEPGRGRGEGEARSMVVLQLKVIYKCMWRGRWVLYVAVLAIFRHFAYFQHHKTISYDV